MTRILVQVQPLQGFVDALLPVPAVLRLDGALQRVEVAVAVAVLVDQRDHVGDAGARGLEDVAPGIQHRFLRHISDAQALLQLQDAVVGLFQAGQDFEERGLARAVAPDQADAFAGLQREIGVVEQRNVAEGELRVERQG